MIPYYDKDGEPIDDVMVWARLFEDTQYRFVGQTDVTSEDGAKFRISSVWMGMNHAYHPNDPPLIFETMVFIDEPGAVELDWADHYMERYTTEAEALAGHKRIVDMVTGALTAFELVEHDTFVVP